MTIYVGSRVSSATGGTITNIPGYTIHTFSSTGTFVSSGSGSVEVLVVGGGGGAFGDYGGGGGGGSVLYLKYMPVLTGVGYTMTVGAAGVVQTGGITTCTYNGGSITAPGGGFGGWPPSGGPGQNNPLGSGGGAEARPGATGGLGANIIGYGFNGGSTTSPLRAGGGGGAGGFGNPGPPGGVGGIGVSYSISGVSSYYGGGGGGGPYGVSNPTSSARNFGYGVPGTTTNGTGGPGVIIIRYIT